MSGFELTLTKITKRRYNRLVVIAALAAVISAMSAPQLIAVENEPAVAYEEDKAQKLIAKHLTLKTGYSASYVAYNERFPRDDHRSHIVFTPQGLKVTSIDMFGPDQNGIYIQNFLTHESWLLDPKRRHYASLNAMDNAEDQNEALWSSGVMATAPCFTEAASASAKNTGSTVKENAAVFKQKKGEYRQGDHVFSIWSCEINDFKTTQIFNEYYGVVVKEMTPNLDVYELVAMREVEFESDYFSPPESYREVSLKEFYLGGDALKPYSETAAVE